MSFHKQQVESTLKKAIGLILARGVADPRVAGMVSVTRIEVADDGRNATIFVSVLPNTHEKTTVAGLNSAAPFVFQQLCKAVAFKTVPHLHFKLDAELKRQTGVLDAIRQGIRREEKSQQTRQADGPDRQEQTQ